MTNKIKYPVINGKKECGNCHELKILDEYNKTKNHYESKCKKCRSEYSREYSNRSEIKQHRAEYHKKYMNDFKNREKTNARQREYNKLEKYKIRKNKNLRAWTAREKQKMIDYKGGKCFVCSYSKCNSALAFHHKNPKEKEGLKSHRTFEQNKKELDKCVLLCCRCHVEVHAGLINI